MTMKELVYNFFYFIKNLLSPKIKLSLFNTLTYHHSFANGAIALPILAICQKLAGGMGVETEGGSQVFKGGVMKNGPLKGGGSCKYMPVIM